MKLSFGKALELAKAGALIAREGWNGKGMFVFLRPGGEMTADFLINEVKSLPEGLKKYYIAQFAHTANEEKAGLSPSDVVVKFTPYLCMKAADGTIVNGWLASQTDMIAEDWNIL
jgi:hypothetical protein